MSSDDALARAMRTSESAGYVAALCDMLLWVADTALENDPGTLAALNAEIVRLARAKEKLEVAL